MNPKSIELTVPGQMDNQQWPRPVLIDPFRALRSRLST